VIENESDGAVDTAVEVVDSLLQSELGSRGAASGQLPETGPVMRDSGEAGGDPGTAEKSAAPISPKCFPGSVGDTTA
jgi:hypothetical protein